MAGTEPRNLDRENAQVSATHNSAEPAATGGAMKRKLDERDESDGETQGAMKKARGNDSQEDGDDDCNIGDKGPAMKTSSTEDPLNEIIYYGKDSPAPESTLQPNRPKESIFSSLFSFRLNKRENRPPPEHVNFHILYNRGDVTLIIRP
jgi:hypothetical protein